MTHQKHSSCNLDLTLRSVNSDNVRSRLFVRETDTRVGFRFDVTNEDALLAQQSAVISPRDGDGLVHEVLVLRDIK